MSVLLIDFESTGIDTKQARITEIGAQLVSDDFTKVHAQYSQLVWETGYPAITPEVEKITGINQAMLNLNAVTPKVAFAGLGELVEPTVRHVIAYNRGYDEELFREEMFRNELTLDPKMNWIGSTPWLCAMVDIEKNHEFKSWKLMHVALDHGVTVNPKELHRAINDVELMRQVLIASGTTLEEMYAYQQSPWIYLRAMVKKPWDDGGKSSGEAKALGYGWQQARGDETKRTFDGCWVKRIKAKNLVAEEKAASFEIRVIGGI